MIEVRNHENITMSPFNYNVTVKRLPFTDKTNFICRKNSTSIVVNYTLCKKKIFKSFALIDPKLKLVAKVHLQSCIINKEPPSTSDHLESRRAAIEQIISEDPKFSLIPKVRLLSCSINKQLPSTSDHLESQKAATEQIISEDPKFRLITKVHLQCCSIINKEHSRDRLESQKVAIEQIISKDPKFTLVPKVHLQCLNVTDKMPNSPSSKFVTKTGIVGKISTNSNNKPDEVSSHLKCNRIFVPNGDNGIIKSIKYVPKEGKALRKREIKNYAELSYNDTLTPEDNLERSYRKHVPVYLKRIAVARKQKENDPFEFVSDSRSDGKKKGCRGRPRKEISHLKKVMGRDEEPSDSDISLYDKSMHEILKEIRQKVSPKKRKYVKRMKIKQNNNVNVLTNQIKNGQLQIVPSNINKNGLVVPNVKVKARPNNEQKQVATKLREQNFNEMSNKNANEFISSGPNNTRPSKDVLHRSMLTLLTQEVANIRTISRVASQNIEQEPDDSDRYFGFDEEYEDDEDISGILPAKAGPNGITALSSIKPSTITQRFTKLTSTPLPNVQRFSPKIRESKKQPKPSGINIISDILVSPPRHTKPPKKPGALEIAMPTVVETSRVDAASPVEDDGDFMGFDNILNRTSWPWRGERLGIRRNPYFLTMKDPSLPCYNQEMILTPKLLEMPKALKRNKEDRHNKVQKSILDFASSNINESTPTKKNNHNRSLFDDAEFSPIRNMSTETTSSNKDGKLETSKGKRNIFGVSKKNNGISPLRQRNREKEDLENYFGFNSPDDRRISGKENVRMTRNRARHENNINEEALPMRVNMKELKKVREEAVEELLDELNLEQRCAEEPTVQEIADKSPDEESQDDDAPHVGLFEDLAEVKPPPRIYGGKRIKRTRAESVSTDTVEEEKPKRKRKDMLTRAEKEEFNKWAATFNAMCSEVEKHNLETD